MASTFVETNLVAARSPQIHSVTVIGGGVAGLAAACALAEAGFKARLIERRGYVGGRASSYEHPGTGEVIDNCQHILLGCCTNLIDLYRRLNVEDQIRWFDRITFVERGGQRSILEPSSLPAPAHSSPAFLKASAFSWGEKIAIARGLMAFLHGLPSDSEENFAQWLVRYKQPQRAIDRFWKPIMISALNEDAERISVHYAGQVIRESFLRSSQGGRMGIPTLPLSALYGKALDYIAARGGQLVLGSSVEQFERRGGQWFVSAGEERYASDALVLALSFDGMAKLLPQFPRNEESILLADNLNQFEHSPISCVHLWFDREITDLDHAVLLDTKFDWMFHTSRLQPGRHGPGSYLELVVSASRFTLPMSQREIVAMAIQELGTYFPAARGANLLKSAVVKEVRATFSIRPGRDHLRPNQTSPWANVFLAGDWTATGWPSTMEGAARSGHLAAEALTRAAGDVQKFLAPDLPSSGFMRLFD